MKQELLTLPEHSSSPTVLVVFVFSFLCSVLNIIVCPFVLFILSFVINFFYFHQSLLNTALWNGSAGFWVTDELNTTNSTYSNTKAHPQKMTQPGAVQTEHDVLLLHENQLSNGQFYIFNIQFKSGCWSVSSNNWPTLSSISPFIFPYNNYASIYMLRFYIQELLFDMNIAQK